MTPPRNREDGNPSAGRPRCLKELPLSDKLERAFWLRVDKRSPGECWPWTGNSCQGYGRIAVCREYFYAHRIAWAIHNGRPPRIGEIIRHQCDNPICVNPQHLLIGTNADNMLDAKLRMRSSNIRKTHCPQGHPYSAENTALEYSQGTLGTITHRKCRACRRERQRRLKNSRPRVFVRMGNDLAREIVARRAAGMSQREVAAAVGVHRRTVGRVEKGSASHV